MSGETAPALPPAILLMGPTASGKTALALELAGRFPLALVSVDSALVFRDMNIGTAKPDAETLMRYPHRLIDVITPEAAYSAARFRAEALAAMAAATATATGKIPLLVGGTMLYYKALLEGIADLPGADPEIRAELDREAAAKGWSALHAELSRLDPVAAARLHPTDSQRIQRALEICRLGGGRNMTDLLAAGQGEPPPYRFLKLALLPSERAGLHARIALRFQAMLAAGLIEEVEDLRRRYRLHADLPSMRSVGYRQVWAYLEGTMDRAELAERGVFATRQLAKRQITWLANNESLAGERFDCLAAETPRRVIERVADFLGAA